FHGHYDSQYQLKSDRLLGGGILTMGPSAAFDFYNSFERDVSGNSRFNPNKFVTASFKSQSGNLLGWGVGVGVGVLVGAAGVAAAPVVLISLGAGIIAQAVWGWSGGSDWAASKAPRVVN
ncbi:MAG: hypothetical protein ABL962_18130, partial [Fimbriimonadaceae bacterium]